nr:TIGR03759 family integrating conjugative element protein [Motilimonas eburnea]
MGLTKIEAVQAASWNLTLEDWVKYKALMKLTPRGIWSKDIDPVTALGVEATTEEERRKYATISLKLETQRIEKELAFERTRQSVAKDMFGDMPLIMPTKKNGEPAYKSVIALFSSVNCDHECLEYIKDSLRTASKTTKVDIYIVGAESDEDIYKFSSDVGVDTDLVNSGKITLNYDSGKFMKLGLRELPAKITVGQNGKIQNESYPYLTKK